MSINTESQCIFAGTMLPPILDEMQYKKKYSNLNRCVISRFFFERLSLPDTPCWRTKQDKRKFIYHFFQNVISCRCWFDVSINHILDLQLLCNSSY